MNAGCLCATSTLAAGAPTSVFQAVFLVNFPKSSEQTEHFALLFAL